MGFNDVPSSPNAYGSATSFKAFTACRGHFGCCAMARPRSIATGRHSTSSGHTRCASAGSGSRARFIPISTDPLKTDLVQFD
jgi:hypothetical protein